ncbi:MAG: hypothetical protein ACOCW6_03185 [Spirochaetota bacterium]
MKFIEITDLQPLASSVLYIKNFEGTATFAEGREIPVRVVYEKHAVGPASIRVQFSEPVNADVEEAAMEYLGQHFTAGGPVR